MRCHPARLPPVWWLLSLPFALLTCLPLVLCQPEHVRVPRAQSSALSHLPSPCPRCDCYPYTPTCRPCLGLQTRSAAALWGLSCHLTLRGAGHQIPGDVAVSPLICPPHAPNSPSRRPPSGLSRAQRPWEQAWTLLAQLSCQQRGCTRLHSPWGQLWGLRWGSEVWS